ncbi:MAG: CBS domain-containing protein [Gammaproteobacteria bacterium]|jgi:CBS domain-containing protein|nr:CBS domain-containing protein [Gammaproteobacteria bacterium]
MFDKIAETPIGDIQGRDPVRVKTKSPLLSVVLALREGGRGAAIVEDGAGKLLGIFTERHLITKLDHSSQSWHDISVDDVMDSNPKTIEASHYIREALSIMSGDRIRQLPILDPDDHALGIVSIRDILSHIAEHYPDEFLNLPPDPEHEASDLHGG